MVNYIANYAYTTMRYIYEGEIIMEKMTKLDLKIENLEFERYLLECKIDTYNSCYVYYKEANRNILINMLKKLRNIERQLSMYRIIRLELNRYW